MMRSMASRPGSTTARGRAAEDEARLTALRGELSRGELELETLREEAHRRRSRLASLTEIQDRYERFQKGVRAIMQEHRAAGGGIDGIKGVVADIVQPPPELETAVEAVLGERLGNVIVDSHEAGVEAIQFLKRTREGRSSFIPRALRAHAVARRGRCTTRRAGTAAASMSATSMSEADVLPAVDDDAIAAAWPKGDGVRGPMLELIGYDRQYDEVASYLLGDVLVVEDLERALTLWRETQTTKTIVTLEGEVIDPKGVVTGGSRESALTGVLEQKREIRELEQVMERLDADLEGALARQIERKQAAADLTRALEEVSTALRADEMALFGLQKDLDRAVQEGSACETRREQLAGQRAGPAARSPMKTSSAWSRRWPGSRATSGRPRRARRARWSCGHGPPR